VEGKRNFLLLEGMKVEEWYGVAASYNKGNNGFHEGVDGSEPTEPESMTWGPS
jgi:hypothetical protein